eukprot:scaffold76486_cov33-Attheya_sp.AAC.8
MAEGNHNSEHPTSITKPLPFRHGSPLNHSAAITTPPQTFGRTLLHSAGSETQITGPHISQAMQMQKMVPDGFFYIFSDIAAHHTSVMADPQDVFHEPHNVSPSFPTTRPGDIVLRLHNHKLQACAIDISMVAPPPHAESYNEQRTKQLRMHTDREIEKWKGMSRPRPEKGKTLDPNNLQKHQVFSDLLLHGISMIPATVGPWGDLGPMLEMLIYGSFPSQVNYMRLIAKHRTRIASTKEAIMTARSTSKVQALLPAAEHGWRHQHGRRWFGPTYQDM